MRTFELVEIDPATGEEDQTLSPEPATWARCERELAQVLADMEEDWDDPNGGAWSWLMIRPAR